MKKALILTAIAALILVGCGDTSKVEGLIESENTEETVSLNDTDKAVAEDAEALAEQYWADKSASPVPETVDLDSIDKSNGDIDIDLTKLDSNMVYAQVFDMVNDPDKYIGQTVKANGTFAYTQDQGKDYFAIFIKDATACCAQGMEFVLKGDYSYPDDYPAVDTKITVTGTFNTYKEGTFTYCQLKDASMTVEK